MQPGDTLTKTILSPVQLEFINCIEMTLCYKGCAGHYRILDHNSIRMLSQPECILHWLLQNKHGTLRQNQILSELKFESIKCIEMTLHCSNSASHYGVLYHNAMRMLSPATMQNQESLSVISDAWQWFYHRTICNECDCLGV
jgi:hypothetical protein